MPHNSFICNDTEIKIFFSILLLLLVVSSPPYQKSTVSFTIISFCRLDGEEEFNRKSHFWMKPLKAHLMCVDSINVEKKSLSSHSNTRRCYVYFLFCNYTISSLDYNFPKLFFYKEERLRISLNSPSALLCIFNSISNSTFILLQHFVSSVWISKKCRNFHFSLSHFFFQVFWVVFCMNAKPIINC
jgi:hypothetical protein